jgi:hypothetical protein
MQLHIHALSAITLGAAMLFGAAATAADLPKEGAYSGAYYAVGTAKATPIGKERVLVAFDETGLQLSNGLLDHTTAHCSGLADIRNGMGQAHGYCVFTDPAGDQVAANFGPDEKHAPDQKSWNGPITLTTGTGKYAGIAGEGKYVVHSHEFRPLSDGTYVNYVTFEGTYKLP